MKDLEFFEAFRRAGEAIEVFNLSPNAAHFLTNGILRTWNERRRNSPFSLSERAMLGKTNLTHNAFLVARDSLVQNQIINYEPGIRNVASAVYGLGPWFYMHHESNHETNPESDDESGAESSREPNPYNKGKEKGIGRVSSAPPPAIAWESAEGWIGITDQDREKWKEAYPDCDIEGELIRMHEWLVSNPAKANKTNWRRFITNWLGNSQKDSGGTVGGVSKGGKRTINDCDDPSGWTDEQMSLNPAKK